MRLLSTATNLYAINGWKVPGFLHSSCLSILQARTPGEPLEEHLMFLKISGGVMLRWMMEQHEKTGELELGQCMRIPELGVRVSYLLDGKLQVETSLDVELTQNMGTIGRFTDNTVRILGPAVSRSAHMSYSIGWLSKLRLVVRSNANQVLHLGKLSRDATMRIGESAFVLNTEVKLLA